MFVADDVPARIAIQVIALGDTPRLFACLSALVAHESRHQFTITCVVNPVARRDGVNPELPRGVRVVRPTMNLGWAGGLHAARRAASASVEYLVWAQDDMLVSNGWLDALVKVADQYPDAGAVGSVEVDAKGRPNGVAAGFAEPAHDVRRWNLTDAFAANERPDGSETFDWVTSKGMLTRASAWDAVGGTDPRLFPLNHVDKDYCTHLRCHGWTVRVAALAVLVHEKHRSAPPVIRHFLDEWQEPAFNERWAIPVESLGRGQVGEVRHECATWSTARFEEIESLVGREASRMVVPAGRFASDSEARRAAATEERFTSSRSWRISAPLRWLSSRLSRPSSSR